MAETYHSKSGKFCKRDSAHTVNKGGQKYRVVRQHRRVGPDGKEVRVRKSKRNMAGEAIKHSIAARQKLALVDRLSRPGLVKIGEALKGK